MEFKHIPVLLNEVIDGLNIKPDGVYVDCTIGGGGHSSEILKRLSPKGHLYGFDRDEMAINASKVNLDTFNNKDIIKENYKNATQKLKEMGITGADGILVDLGVSSPQIDLAERGFSILHDGRLDMRMDTVQELDAYKVVNEYSKERLINILYTYGEENNARRIVDKIIERRKIKPIETTQELKTIIESAFSKKLIYSKGNVSQQTFQAIRIEVNGELDELDTCIKNLIDFLKPGGRIAIISFHSLEDRIVKNIFKQLATDCICPPRTPICICGHTASLKLCNHKPITASEEELKQNSRSSCAKLRIAEKL